MSTESLSHLSRSELVRALILVAALSAAVLWASLHFLQPAPPRRIVLASGASYGVYHRAAERYKEILAREGVTVEERITGGAGDNLRLLLDPNSGVDVAFMQGGVATFPAAADVVMLASLYYEPLWIFYRGAEPLTMINLLRGKRIAVGAEGSGTQAFVLPLLAINGLTRDNTTFLPLSGDNAMAALKQGDADVVMLISGAQTPLVLDALREPSFRLMSLVRADAYTRRLPYLNRLTLPAGTIDLAQDIPPEEVTLIGTKAMLAARDGLHPALINLLTDAARQIHGEQGYFEAAGEFPGTVQVDLRVSPDADQHRRFGPSALYRYFPFWVATFLERAIIVVLPLIVVLVPVFNFLPQFFRWRIRSRIYRWYGELSLLERDVAVREGALPIERWLQDIDRIERGVEGVKTPASFASEAYTLREHIALVRRAVLAKAAAPAAPAP